MTNQDSDPIVELQEAAAFTEHRLDQLDHALRELADRLERVTARLQSVEQRLATGASEETDASEDIIDQMPPHAARAPYDRPERSQETPDA